MFAAGLPAEPVLPSPPGISHELLQRANDPIKHAPITLHILRPVSGIQLETI
jgi:hypothetical protein